MDLLHLELETKAVGGVRQGFARTGPAHTAGVNRGWGAHGVITWAPRGGLVGRVFGVRVIA